jgi:hypothetical protein
MPDQKSVRAGPRVFFFCMLSVKGEAQGQKAHTSSITYTIHVLYNTVHPRKMSDVRTTIITCADSKEKPGVWDPMPELTITSPYAHPQSRLQHIYHRQPYARVDFILQSGTLDLASVFLCASVAGLELPTLFKIIRPN